MPRIALEPRFQVEYLSILDSDGNLDTALEPKLADQGPGSCPAGEHLHLAADGLDGAVVPRDGGDDLAGLADREAPALLRGPPRRRPAGAEPARSADHDPG